MMNKTIITFYKPGDLVCLDGENELISQNTYNVGAINDFAEDYKGTSLTKKEFFLVISEIINPHEHEKTNSKQAQTYYSNDILLLRCSTGDLLWLNRIFLKLT